MQYAQQEHFLKCNPVYPSQAEFCKPCSYHLLVSQHPTAPVKCNLFLEVLPHPSRGENSTLPQLLHQVTHSYPTRHWLIQPHSLFPLSFKLFQPLQRDDNSAFIPTEWSINSIPSRCPGDICQRMSEGGSLWWQWHQHWQNATTGSYAGAPESPIHHLSTIWPEGSRATVLWHVTSEPCMQRRDKNLSNSCLANWYGASHAWDNKIIATMYMPGPTPDRRNTLSNSFNPHNKLLRQVSLVSFWRLGNWGLEALHNLPQITSLVKRQKWDSNEENQVLLKDFPGASKLRWQGMFQSSYAYPYYSTFYNIFLLLFYLTSPPESCQFLEDQHCFNSQTYPRASHPRVSGNSWGNVIIYAMNFFFQPSG